VVRGVVLAACVVLIGSGPAAARTHSAVLQGTVLAAPAVPVCMPRVPCLRPAAGVVLAFSRGGIVRARATTNADGSYRRALAPGTYDVRVVRPTGVRRLNPASVRLVANQVRRLTFYLDTGIR
jgi:carboxypeptidase family protein